MISTMLDIKLLVVCIAVLIASILYIFFWNRFLGFILGLLLNFALWDERSSSIWIEIGSISFSLLAGRILLKDLRYFSNDQSIHLVKCQINWRYWVRRTAHEEDVGLDGAVKGEPVSSIRRNVPCRINMSVEGLEWSLYNRIAAYEAILLSLSQGRSSTEKTELNMKSTVYGDENIVSLSEPTEGETIFSGLTSRLQSLPLPRKLSRVTIIWRRLVANIRTQLPNWDPKNLLPFSFEIATAAIMLGNASTESRFVGKFDKARGTFGIVQSRSKFDINKRMLCMSFSDVLLTCVDNFQYRGRMTEIGKEMKEQPESRRANLPRSSRYSAFRILGGLLESFALPNFRRKSKNRTAGHRKASRRGVDEPSHIGADFSTLEYAIDRKILETQNLDLMYYVDSAGIVPHDLPTTAPDETDYGNGDSSPEWGLDLVIHGGALRYGPWADRQRVQIQQVFFPMMFHHLSPTSHRKPGDPRLHLSLNIFVELQGVTSLYVPFRESSKDWQWDGRVNIPRDGKYRKAGSIELRSSSLSSIKYIVPMVANESGYAGHFDIHLKDILVTSSVNDIVLLETKSLAVFGRLPTPLHWDQERKWNFQISLDHPSMYIIRDHINLFVDLGKDWASGSPSDFHTFVPMHYSIQLEFHHYELNLYANDHNIIDKPLSKDDNVLFTLHGKHLDTRVSIPSDKFRPEFNTVRVSLDAPDLGINLALPKWNTHAFYAAHRRTDIAHIPIFKIDATYTFFSSIQENYIDQLDVNIKASKPALKLYGWVVRHFMVLRENYFGSFTGFSTSREYLSKKQVKLPVGDPIELKYRKGRSNIFQLQLTFIALKGIVLLPAALPGYEHFQERKLESKTITGACVIGTIPQLQVELRLNDYYMEMNLDVFPLNLTVMDDYSDQSLFGHQIASIDKEHLILDGLTVSANRLFGPQPHTSAYLCIWQIKLDEIKFAMTASEARVFVRALNSLAHNFVDIFNAPATSYILPVNPDITFLSVGIGSVDGRWISTSAVLRVSLRDGTQMNSNNLAGEFYRSVTSIRIPDLHLHLLTPGHLNDEWLECASFHTSVSLDVYQAPINWRSDAMDQKSFINIQDESTGRARRFLVDMDINNTEHMSNGPLYLPKVSPPQAVEDDDFEFDIGDSKMAWGEPDKLTNNSRATDRNNASSVEIADRSEILGEVEVIGRKHSVPKIKEEIESLRSRGLRDILPYWKICSRYRYIAHQNPLEWDHRSLLLAKSKLSLPTPASTPGSMPNSSRFSLDELHRDNEDAEFDVTTIRIAAEETRVYLTPILIEATHALTREFFDDYSSPELQIDSLIYTLFKSTESPTKLALDVVSSSLRITAAQRIMNFEEAFAAKDHETLQRQPDDEGDEIVSIIDLWLFDVHLFGEKTISSFTSGVSFQCDVGVLSLYLYTAVVYLSRERVEAEPATTLVLSIDVDSVEASSRPSKNVFALNSIFILFSKLLPQMAVATIQCLSGLVSVVASDIRQGSARLKNARQKLILDVINSIPETSTVDFLSTIQPSFLVQVDDPGRLRQDLNWKFLFQLRDTLRYIDDDAYNSIHKSLRLSENPSSLPDINRALEGRSSTLVVDGEKLSTSNLKVLESLFGSVDNNPTGVGLDIIRPDTCLSFKLGLLEIEYQDAEAQTKDIFTISSVYAQLDTVHREILLLTPSTTLSPRSSIEMNRESGTERLQSRILTLDIGDVSLDITPGLSGLMEHIIILQRSRISAPGSKPLMHTSILPSISPSHIRLIEWTTSVRKISLRLSADHLAIELSTHGLTSSTVYRLPRGKKAGEDMALNQAFGFDEMSIKAIERPNSKSISKGDGMLASIIVRRGLASLVHLQGTTTRNIIHTQSIQLEVPRSALHLYHSLEAWRNDYNPGINRIQQLTLSDSSRSSSRQMHTAFQLQISIAVAGVSLQIMHGTWLSWQVNNISLSSKSASQAQEVFSYAFDVELLSQAVVVTVSSPDPPLRSNQLSTAQSPMKLKLPSIRVSGSYYNNKIDALALVDIFSVRFTPGHWDKLLSVQQKFGSDFQDLLTLINETRKRSTLSVAEDLQKKKSTSLIYHISGRWKGFRIALSGPSSTQFLECQDIDWNLSNTKGREWAVECSDLAASFMPGLVHPKSISSIERSKRVAFLTIDIKLRGGDAIDLSEKIEKYLDVYVSRFHAVMHPSSMGELGDFIDYLQAEILLRKEERAAEMHAFKEKAKIIMYTLNISPNSAAKGDGIAFFANRGVKVDVSNLGVAFPLALEGDISQTQKSSGSHSAFPIKAFLFYVKSFKFETHRGETGQAVMDGFSFQFVPRFRQSEPNDFAGETHQTRNRLLYPQMTAHLRAAPSASSTSSRKLLFGASISGFVLDIDPSITDYIFSLIDVYREGKSRVEKLATGWTSGAQLSSISDQALEARYNSLPTTNIQASLAFLSGQVRMHSVAKLPRSNSTPADLQELSAVMEVNRSAEVFMLPEVSVWCEFRAIPALEKLSSDRRGVNSTLMFKCTIHSSQNTLRPSLLPFLTELVSNIERRMQKSPWHPARPSSLAIQEIVLPASDAQTNSTTGAIVATSMRISFSLRIDRSKLELTCKPDVNVIAGLHWESGGFVLNISPGARRLSLSGTVDGLTARLRHGFLSEDCVRIDARNLTFSVTFSKALAGSGKYINSISISMDTEISSSIRFTRLQDLLCFKAVWLDRIPVFTMESSESTESASQPMARTTKTLPDTEPGFTTAIVFRIRHILLEADLGQSITTVKLNCSTLLVRTLVSEGVSDFSVSVASVELEAGGNLSGHARTSDFTFETIRVDQDSGSVLSRQSKMLQLAISSGELEASLESDQQWLLQYKAEPLKTIVFDNWDLIDPSVVVESRILHLHFKVIGGNVVALMTIGTIPKLIMYAGKFRANLEAQQEGASRESHAFRSARSTRPENVLTDVANAMLQNARTKFNAGSNLSYTVAQHVSMELKELLFVLFPRALDDTELARFVGRQIKASLDRVIDSQGKPESRELSLSLSHMAISQLIKYSFEYATKSQLAELMKWSSSEVRGTQQNTIFSLPAVDMRMVTTEELQGDRKLLFYDFESRFLREVGKEAVEDINITLNLGLYSWLTSLNKAFSRELQRAQDYAEWRQNPMVSTGQKKTYESPGNANQILGFSPSGASPTPLADSPTVTTSPLSFNSPRSSRIIQGASNKSPAGPSISVLSSDMSIKDASEITYIPRTRHIERLTVHQLGEATPDVMHPFFTKRAGFNLETALPQYIHEYATLPIEEILKALFKIYQKQLKTRRLSKDEYLK